VLSNKAVHIAAIAAAIMHLLLLAMQVVDAIIPIAEIENKRDRLRALMRWPKWRCIKFF
jgi:hypothetical protein